MWSAGVLLKPREWRVWSASETKRVEDVECWGTAETKGVVYKGFDKYHFS